jgi:hypothetical protein
MLDIVPVYTNGVLKKLKLDWLLKDGA